MCRYSQCALAQSAFRLHKLSGTAMEVWHSHRDYILASVSVTAKVKMLLRGLGSQSPLSASSLTRPLRKVQWCRLHAEPTCLHLQWIASCVCVICLCACILNQCGYGLSRSCSCIKMFLIKFPAFLSPAGGLGGGGVEGAKTPDFRGTLASNQQATNLSDWRRDESSGVHLELPVCMCFCVCRTESV